ncbi:TrkH family potassium uptake protein [Craterilacuibacter sp.]|uniref:TrkH family potassium uptake protein n=1 Tax=Craterilacuibacter sp. TaxID=2870909 RepID=UPI003F2E0B1F
MRALRLPAPGGALGKLLPIAHVFSKLIMLFSCMFIVPAGVSVIYKDHTLEAFLLSGVAGLAIGLFAWAATRRFERELKPRDGFILVVALWVGFAATAAIPFMLFDSTLSFTDAFFEAISALTTNGATVLFSLDVLPPAINFWRHFMQWMGGMGIIVLAVAILPLLGVGGMQVYKAETPGPMKDAKLAPRITQAAKSLWTMYCVLTVLCISMLYLVGMSAFDALCHGLSTVALGGFSTRDASVGHYDSLAIELVIAGFTLLSATNYATHFLAWKKRSAAPYRVDNEFIAMLLVILSSILMLAFYLWWQDVYSLSESLRHVTFNVISIATASGFASTDYGQWPLFVPVWMLFLSCFTACSGSVGGGIKMIRSLILFGQAKREMTQLLHPQAIIPLKVSGRTLPDNVAFSVLGFIFVYILSVVVLTFVLLGSGLDFQTAASAIVSCINNAGPGLGEVGPSANYAGLNDFQTWVCSLAMLLGRLEIFTILILFTPAFWRK